MPDPSTSVSPSPSFRATLIVTGVALLFVIMPALFWHSTWFGKTLTDQEISEYLSDQERPRRTQHALAQLSQRMSQRDPEVKQWYPELLTLAGHPLPQIRLTVAWLMGQDTASGEFHSKLLEMIDDPDPLVARNVALSLAGFGDPIGRPILRSMLRPFTIQSPRAGVLSNRLQQGDSVDQDTLLARVLADGEAEPAEVRSPVPGQVAERLLADGAQVRVGDDLMVLSPGSDHVFEALRALFLVGGAEDLDDVRRFLTPRDEMPPQVAEQARLTADEIRSRAGL
jgi:hypothetical protein